jgi:hypothetical protein
MVLGSLDAAAHLVAGFLQSAGAVFQGVAELVTLAGRVFADAANLGARVLGASLGRRVPAGLLGPGVGLGLGCCDLSLGVGAGLVQAGGVGCGRGGQLLCGLASAVFGGGELGGHFLGCLAHPRHLAQADISRLAVPGVDHLMVGEPRLQVAPDISERRLDPLADHDPRHVAADRYGAEYRQRLIIEVATAAAARCADRPPAATRSGGTLPPGAPGAAEADLADWLTAIFDHWLADRRPVAIRMFDSVTSTLRRDGGLPKAPGRSLRLSTGSSLITTSQPLMTRIPPAAGASPAPGLGVVVVLLACMSGGDGGTWRANAASSGPCGLVSTRSLPRRKAVKPVRARPGLGAR